MLDIATGGANSALGLPARSGGVHVGDPADLTLIRFDREFATLPSAIRVPPFSRPAPAGSWTP
ncbi:hypothetical protein I0Q12_06370 [Rhodococcus sp. CX]|nr:hypothetical protein [Rhodococcus sp. CX]